MSNINMLDVKDIQRIFKIGRNAAYSLMKSECFPSIKIGKKRVVSEKALEEWIEDNTYSEIIIEE